VGILAQTRHRLARDRAEQIYQLRREALEQRRHPPIASHRIADGILTVTN
jgi:hypothetical protein